MPTRGRRLLRQKASNLQGFPESPKAQPLTGICCFGVENLEQLAMAFGDDAAESLLRAQAKQLGAIFGAENVQRRRGVAGLIAHLRHMNRAESREQVERALEALNSGPVSAGSPVTVFAGIAWSDYRIAATEGEDVHKASVLRSAIASASAASANGRRLYIQGAESEAALQTAHLLCDLRNTMIENRLTILAQEICGVESDVGEERHFEILIQMSSCDGKVQPPGRFLPLAEKSELIEYVDRWVFRRVLIGHGEALRRRPWISLSLNISGRTLSQPGTWPFLREIIREARIDPSRLHLEITETSRITDMDQAIATISAVREAGIGVALDDFGAGLSGYGYLAAFDVNCIKIDGALVPNVVDRNSIEAEILRSIMALAKRLKLDVVAEHVSSLEILTALALLGITRVQGYVVGKPRPLEEVFLDC